jgi:outer membrane autotransporter protein
MVFTTSNGFDGGIKPNTLFNAGLWFITGPRFAVKQTLLQPYVKAQLRYEFAGGSGSNIASFSFGDNSLRGLKYELGGGFNFAAGEYLSLYIDGLQRKGQDYSNISGVLGVRAAF